MCLLSLQKVDLHPSLIAPGPYTDSADALMVRVASELVVKFEDEVGSPICLYQWGRDISRLLDVLYDRLGATSNLTKMRLGTIFTNCYFLCLN